MTKFTQPWGINWHSLRHSRLFVLAEGNVTKILFPALPSQSSVVKSSRFAVELLIVVMIGMAYKSWL